MAAVQQGMAVYGTCAGMILLAKHASGGEPPLLRLMDIEVARNASDRARLEQYTESVREIETRIGKAEMALTHPAQGRIREGCGGADDEDQKVHTGTGGNQGPAGVHGLGAAAGEGRSDADHAGR